ncbi:MAG: PilT/PilU family type 4a pilus ATPase [Vicinamibacteria bacterium]|nr:PilT/PilU family type 4a pilus ATPase [Vicinamibacteria bacterium]
MARLDSFLRLVAEQQASDLHFHAGGMPMIRHDGDLIALPFRILTELEARRFIVEILTPDQRSALERDQQVDFIYALPEVGRFRASVFMQNRGIGAVFRVIRNQIPTLAELRLPEVLGRLARLENGLVIVTGPTGAGKSTTLAAMVREINENEERHIITIEDPIEYIHEPIKSAVTHREVGAHTGSFASGLRAALRESPDVLVLGEMRDLESVQLALQAAETGILVLGTLHTGSAAKAIDRILDVIPEETRDQARGTLALVLRGVVAQRLAKLATGDGRIAVLEVLLQSWAIANLIRENKIHQIEAQLQSAGMGSGSQGFDAMLLSYVQEGLIMQEEALRLASYPEALRSQMSETSEASV